MNKKVIIIILIFAFISLALYSFKELTNKEPEDSLRELVPNDYRDTEEYKNSDISDWEMYTSKELGFEMKIPRNWVCKKEELELTDAVSCFDEKAEPYEIAERLPEGYPGFSFGFPSEKQKKISLYDSLYEEVNKDIEIDEKYNSDTKQYFTEVQEEEAVIRFFKILDVDYTSIDYTSIRLEADTGGKTVLVCGGDQKLCRDFTKSATETFRLLK